VQHVHLLGCLGLLVDLYMNCICESIFKIRLSKKKRSNYFDVSENVMFVYTNSVICSIGHKEKMHNKKKKER
jgi:hypothetical protein